MKWNATTLVTFFQSTRTDQNSSTKFYEILKCQNGPLGPGNWTKKVFPVFPRNIQNRERLKSIFQFFFGIVSVFFENFLLPKVFSHPSILRRVATEWMLKNLKGKNSLQFSSALWDFFRKKSPLMSPKSPSSIFLIFATEWMLKNL